jgi:hypothetical protein
MVTAVTLYKAWEVPTHFSQKLIFALVYSLAYVGFTIALTLVPLGNYLGKLNERVPQPIFVHTDRLLDIVLHTAAKSLGNKRGSEDEDIFKRFEVIEFNQSPADGGLQVLVRECKLVQLDLGSKPQITEDVWKIDADKWGRIRSLTPGTIRQRVFLSPNLDDSSHARLLPSGKPNSGN